MWSSNEHARSILDAPQRIGVREALPAVECPTDGVLLRVRACGVCGGDVKSYRYHSGPFPMFLRGHEYTGEVLQVGADAATFRPGDAVVRCFATFCGLCTNCLLGSPNFCTGVPWLANAGGFAEHVASRAPVRDSGLFPKPPELSFAHAAVCEPADCAIGAALRGSPKAGQSGAVIGLDGIGHFIAQVLYALGVRVIGIDTSQNRLAGAGPFCTEIIDSSSVDPIAAVTEITGGVGADRTYEVVGIEPTLATALQLTRMSGIVVLVGVFRESMKHFYPEWLFRRDLTLIAANGTPLVLEYIARRIIRPETVVTTFALSEAQEAFAAQASAACLKSVVVPN